MKQSIHAAIIAAILTMPVVASAQQSSTGSTRAQVREELVQLEKAGYSPWRRDDPHYPADIQAATARLQATSGVAQRTASSGYGSATDGSSQAGRSTTPLQTERSTYSGH
jgi:hypothetical protein